jgi:hypothetical protein
LGGLEGAQHGKLVSAEVEELVHAAFEKSWRFVSTDPMLAHGDIEELRTRLSQRLSRLAQNGERDLCRLANGAIGEQRRGINRLIVQRCEIIVPVSVSPHELRPIRAETRATLDSDRRRRYLDRCGPVSSVEQISTRENAASTSI